MEESVLIDVCGDSFRSHDNRSEGAFLAWRDIDVTVRNSNMSPGDSKRVTILDGLTGYAEPGRVLALMGPSGSGKTTLLDALAGRLHSNMKQTGEIFINGRKQDLAFGTSAYVTQDDILMTTLTVRETVHYSALLQLPESVPKREKLERADLAIKMMGLQDCSDTTIGGRTTAGISGGQRKRLSICIEILTRPRLLFLDEPTSGLDSAASSHVMSYIIKLAQQEQITVIASIHQPSSELFKLFEYLCLLSYGNLVYFGHSSAASKLFAVNGFPCPSMRNPSDHYLRTINNDFESGEEEETSTEKAIKILVNSYKSSEEYSEVQTQVSIMSEHGGVKIERRSRAKFFTQCLVLTQRSFVNMYRDPGYYRLRFFVYIVVCSCAGTVFHTIGNSSESIQTRISYLSFIGGFVTFMSIGGFPSFVEDMKIFGRERLNGHYGVSAFVMSNTLSAIPYLFINALIPGALSYYLSGLQKGFDKFIYFALNLFVGTSVIESLMMMVASIVPDFLMGIITGAGVQGVVLLNSGFFRLPDDLPNILCKYPLYYIIYGSYGNHGFYKNEFEGLVFPSIVNNQTRMITGKEVLRDTYQVQVSYSKWINLGILVAMVIIYRLIFFGMIKIGEMRLNKCRASSIS